MLCLEGTVSHDLVYPFQVYSFQGCQHLQRLVLKTLAAWQLAIGPECYVILDNELVAPCLTHQWKGWNMMPHSLADLMILRCGDSALEQTPRSILGHMPDMRQVEIHWPQPGQGPYMEYVEGEQPYCKHRYNMGAIRLLAELVPADGQAVHNLRRIVIHAPSIKVLIPGGLPNLEELVIGSQSGWRSLLAIHWLILPA